MDRKYKQKGYQSRDSDDQETRARGAAQRAAPKAGHAPDRERHEWLEQ